MTEPPHFTNRTLQGCLVVVTAERRASEFGTALERRGAEVFHAPVMSVVPHVDDETLVAATRSLIASPPDVVVVTTGIGFRGWVEAADAAGVATELVDVLRGARIVARGPKARGAIQAADLQADWVAESETSAEIRDLLLTEGVDGLVVAVQHHGSGADGLDEALAAAGADVRSLVVYRWGPPRDPAVVAESVRQVAGKRADAVVFTSAPGAHAWLEAAAGQGLTDEVVRACTDPHGVLAAAVGPITATPLEHVGIAPLIPDRARLGALVRTLGLELAERRGLHVDTVAGPLRLLRGAALLNGHVLALSPSSLAVLRLLTEANGAVVPPSRLLEALPGTSTSQHAAEVAVARLREAVDCPEIVRTVVKRGYRLALAPSS